MPAANNSFDSAAPTNPTGNARIADGRKPSRSIRSIRRKRAVGALPIATTAPPNRSPQRSPPPAPGTGPGRAAFFFDLPRPPGHLRVFGSRSHGVAGGQMAPDDTSRGH